LFRIEEFLCLEGIRRSTQRSRNARPSTLKRVTSNTDYPKKKPSVAGGQPSIRSMEVAKSAVVMVTANPRITNR